MDGAQAPHQVHGVDADHGPTVLAAEAFREDAERDAVVGVVEGGHQHAGVGDEEIGVAGGQAQAVE